MVLTSFRFSSRKRVGWFFVVSFLRRIAFYPVYRFRRAKKLIKIGYFFLRCARAQLYTLF